MNRFVLSTFFINFHGFAEMSSSVENGFLVTRSFSGTKEFETKQIFQVPSKMKF